MKTKVSVQLTVQIECTSNWGDDCTIEQVKRQAKVEATAIARRSLDKDPLVKRIEIGDVTLTTTL